MFNTNTIYSRIMGIEAVRRQSIISLISQIGIAFFGFLSTMYFAHVVGASVLGAYFLFVAYYGIISMVTDGGFGGATVKRISEGEEQDEYLSAFFVVRTLVVVAVVTSLIVVRGFFVDLDSSGAFIWLLLALLLSILSGTVSYGVAGCGKIGILAVSNFFKELLRICVQVIAIFLGFGVAGLAGGFVAGLITTAIIEWRFFDLHFVRFGWRHIKSLSTFSFWLFLTSSGIMLFSYTDTVMIGYFLSNTDVGVYRVIFQFTTLTMFVTTALVTTLWPKISLWGKNGMTGYIEESLSRAFSYSLLIAVPVFAGGVLLADKMLYFFYGAEFARGYTTLMLLLIVQLANVFQGFFMGYLTALDNPKDASKTTALAAAVNIVLNSILIPVAGIEGAAVATLFSTTVNVFLARRVLSQVITIRIEYNSLLNILKASFMMSIFIGLYRSIIPLSSVWLTLAPVILGGIMYWFLIFKLDIKIYHELKEIALKMNVPLTK